MKNAVVFGFTSNHAGAVASVVMDLNRVSPGAIDEFVFLHDGRLLRSDADALRSLGPSRFMHYDPGQYLRLRPGLRVVTRFTAMVFSKYECARLLADYDTVTWLDYDIVVRADISEIFAPCSSGLKVVPGSMPVLGQFYEAVSGYDMETEGICGSTFTFDRNIADYHEVVRFFYQNTEKYQDILRLGEQGIFDLAIQHFRIDPVLLDPLIYTPHPTNYREDARILHAYGGPKFWDGLHNDQWMDNYARWLAMGGAPIVATPPPPRPPRLHRMVRRLSRKAAAMASWLRG